MLAGRAGSGRARQARADASSSLMERAMKLVSSAFDDGAHWVLSSAPMVICSVPNGPDAGHFINKHPPKRTTLERALVAPLRHAGRHQEGPFIGKARQSSADVQEHGVTPPPLMTPFAT
jgi:hypothetical protein